jgi:RND family efflux transporter MFP subunit
MTRKQLRTWLPVSVIGVAAVITWGLLATRPQVVVDVRPPSAPLVRVVVVAVESIRLDVSTHGTVAPRTETDLIPEVSGPVVVVSPNLVSGGFFLQGDVLLEIDPRDYAAAVVRAGAVETRTRSELVRARKDLARRRSLHERGAASDSQVDDAVNAEHIADASLREARSALEQAERDLERTRVAAPFDGRVRDQHVGVGQFVNRGSAVARLYATDYVEVRLPIADRQLAFVDLPLARSFENAPRGPRVTLHANFAGGEYQWEGVIDRTEGEIDPRTRTITAVARVESPYEVSGGRPPLAVGLFVRAEIEGREVSEAILLPRSAVSARNRVWVVDASGTLRERSVDVIRAVEDQVVVRGGLVAGEKVVVSTLEAAVDGMQVEIASASHGHRS